ncbi:amine oxidase [Aspergillus flavus]|nr:amine oxidase [Aspergillus flavus]
MGFFHSALSFLMGAFSQTMAQTAPPQMEGRIDVSKYSPPDIITRDVCIIGGGPAGTHAAIRLRQHNKSVVVLEKQDRLGGQTNTYIDPESGRAVDYGVTYFQNLSSVREMFEYFEIPLTKAVFDYKMHMFDFRTGTPVQDSSKAEMAAFTEKYMAQLAKYPYLKTGFDLPDPVPEDLLLPFGEFVQKYDMMPAVGQMGAWINALGDWQTMPTLYIMKYMCADTMKGVKTGFVRPADHNNSAIYDAARKELGEDALLNSRVVQMDRDDTKGWVYMEVQSGSQTRLIRAKKIIVAFPPHLDNFGGFDVSPKEKELFSQFQHIYFYPALVRIQGIPDNVCYINRGADHPFLRPQLPGILMMRTSDVQGLCTVHFSSRFPVSEEQVKAGIVKGISSIRETQGIDGTDLEFVRLANHSPYQMTVSADAIAHGFYQELNALQGERHTYYTGATFDSHNTPQIWNFTEQLLQEQILKSLE